ncbi:hypothetical protein HUJ04_010058 [Dendroctonus ponderosae]|nr:hypothetical protein HUJ04_010058 [Dendroctonus ponderosae]
MPKISMLTSRTIELEGRYDKSDYQGGNLNIFNNHKDKNKGSFEPETEFVLEDVHPKTSK